MTGPDTRMDQAGKYDDPANPLPAKCPHCTMPDLDHVAKPYFLAKGFAAPAETSPAEVGNFLVRPRVRKLLEIAVPGACTFHPTAELKSKKPTDWSLAVPANTVEVPDLVTKGPKCPKCREPRDGYNNGDNYWTTVKSHPWPALDLFKGLQWYAAVVREVELETTNKYRAKEGLPPLTPADRGITPPPHPERWTRQQLDRKLFFSARLHQLFKKAKVKGQLTLYTAWDFVKPTPDDLAWVDEKLQLLAAHRLVDAPAATNKKSAPKPTATAKPAKPAKPNPWFTKYLADNAPKKKPATPDFPALERKHKLTLPQDYKDFLSAVGPTSFTDVMETEGFAAHVLPATKLDSKSYRRGKLKDLDESDAEFDGLLFATTDHGDAFLFDLSDPDPHGNYPIYHHDHEQNTLNPFAPTFAACIKRLHTRT
jgi:hypothetical protein